MPGPLPRALRAKPRAAGLALLLAAGLALPGCYARRSIPSDPPEQSSRAVRVKEAEPAAATPEQKSAVPAEAKAVPSAQAAQPVQAAQAQNATEAQPRVYMVQVGSFSTEKNAEGVLSWLKAKGYKEARVVRLEQGDAVFHRVQAGPFQDLAAARKALEELKPDWPQAFIPAD